ncbi:MAG: hypothetical protein CME62_04115 [Halobacteriovoraceae bacterium]|nr:hypothetical protein [Halobacteriovoraceae bacterium]|tara:strand:+ start:3936 stop:4547 length:612 start_codon:yes stop_codon:yes gene_type:complete
MRKIITFLILSISVGFTQTIGTIVDFTGDPTLLKSNDKTALNAVKSAKLTSDTSLYCPLNCTLKIKFYDPIVFIKLGQNSMVNIKKIDSQLLIKLHKGFVQAQVSDKDTEESFKIITPNSELVSGHYSNVLASYTPYFSKSSFINFKGKTTVKINESAMELTQNKMLQYESRSRAPQLSDVQTSEYKKILQAFNTGQNTELNN